QCVLCSAASESHDHLFFNCVYSAEILSHFVGSVWPNPPSDMQTVVLSLTQNPSHLPPQLLSVIKLVFQAIIYLVWKERNSGIFRGTSASPVLTIRAVDRITRDRLLSYPAPDISSPSLLQLYFQHLGSFSE
ncbi:hypothetical protein EUTSA_v10017934mg, partial [Eutrema salsugineum]